MKALNVFGIIFAWIVSIALVIALVAAPIVMSALSFLKPVTVTNLVSSIVTAGLQGATSSAKEEYVPVSAGTEGAQLTLLADGNAAQSNSAASVIDPDTVKNMLGVEVDAATLEKVLTSDTMNDLLGAYTEDLANAISGSGESTFNADKIKQIVNDNLDEIVSVIQEVTPELSAEELKNQIQKAVDDNAEAIVDALPKAEDIKNELVGENPVVGILFTIMAKKTVIQAAIIGALVLLMVIIFFLRFPGFRGLRWLAVDLFVAGGIGALLCVGLKVVTPIALNGLAFEVEAMTITILSTVLTTLTNGLIWRFAVILVAGGVSLTGYLLIKKFRNKNTVLEEMSEELVALEEPAEETVAEETAEQTESV